MNRAQAVRKFCLDCAGNSKEVTLCHIFGCPLWEYRMSGSIKGKVFRERMDSIKKRWPGEYAYNKQIFIDHHQDTANKLVKRYLASYFEINKGKPIARY